MLDHIEIFAAIIAFILLIFLLSLILAAVDRPDSKRRYERATIVILGMTGIFAFFAASAAIWSGIVFQRQLIEMREDRRAWVGPVSPVFSGIPNQPNLSGGSVIDRIPFRNTGREPAVEVAIFGNGDTISITATPDEIAEKEKSFADYCFSINGEAASVVEGSVSVVLFPSGGDTNSDYTGTVTINPGLIDWDTVYGRKYLLIRACAVYKTNHIIRHTAMCYYAQAGKISAGALPLCNHGNKAE
jgi:hypothetical protein